MHFGERIARVKMARAIGQRREPYSEMNNNRKSQIAIARVSQFDFENVPAKGCKN